MKQRRAGMSLLLALIGLCMAALACSLAATSEPARQGIWTPAPVTAAPAPAATAVVIVPTPSAVVVPAPTRPAETWVAPTPYPLVPLVLPTATAQSRPLAAQAPPTLDPHHVIITENDIADAIAGGAAENNGARVTNPVVRFTGGKTIITADQAGYGLITVQNLNVVGRLVARDGALQLETESVSPGGLAGAVIPSLINQAFKQYTSKWYVEDVQTLEGRVELRIR